MWKTPTIVVMVCGTERVSPVLVTFSFQVLESCVKNCGNAIHEEVATGSFMNDMKDLVNVSNEINHVYNEVKPP